MDFILLVVPGAYLSMGPSDIPDHLMAMRHISSGAESEHEWTERSGVKSIQ